MWGQPGYMVGPYLKKKKIGSPTAGRIAGSVACVPRALEALSSVPVSQGKRRGKNI